MDPILVIPWAEVPLFTVTHSRITLRSPIWTKESSSENFKSCGIALITEPGKILQFLPISVPEQMTTLFPIHVLSLIWTFGSIIENGPIKTFFPIFESELIIAEGWIFFEIVILSYHQV